MRKPYFFTLYFKYLKDIDLLFHQSAALNFLDLNFFIRKLNKILFYNCQVYKYSYIWMTNFPAT